MRVGTWRDSNGGHGGQPPGLQEGRPLSSGVSSAAAPVVLSGAAVLSRKTTYLPMPMLCLFQMLAEQSTQDTLRRL